ncbi:nucleosome assembly protein 1-like 4 [Hermetia illucens]|nr:nucleosome assembly protein 1-like 4 [Hermetia illucens]
MSETKEVVHADGPEGSGAESEGEEKSATRFFLNSPAFMSGPMRRHFLQEMVKMLPEKVRNRVTALKHVQLEQLKLESKFYEEVYELERKYQGLYQPLFDKRQKIISGEVEPEVEKATWKSDDEDTEELSDKMKEITLKLKKNLDVKYPDDVKGVPDFWLTVFRSAELLSEMVQEHDEAALKKLRDIKIVYADNPMSYTLEFHFDKNDYFSDPVLTKKYFLKTAVDGEYPFGFEGPEIYKCEGCTIHWEKSMNLTVKTIRKKQKHKARGAVRTITKQVPNDSFFNFFNPPQINEEDKDKEDEETQGILSTDFEIGHFLRARIIPKAVLYYTGDVIDEDYDDDDDDYDEEEEEEDEEEEESEEDDARPKRKPIGGKKPTPNECPNQ